MPALKLSFSDVRTKVVDYLKLFAAVVDYLTLFAAVVDSLCRTSPPFSDILAALLHRSRTFLHILVHSCRVPYSRFVLEQPQIVDHTAAKAAEMRLQHNQIVP